MKFISYIFHIWSKAKRIWWEKSYHSFIQTFSWYMYIKVKNLLAISFTIQNWSNLVKLIFDFGGGGVICIFLFLCPKTFCSIDIKLFNTDTLALCLWILLTSLSQVKQIYKVLSMNIFLFYLASTFFRISQAGTSIRKLYNKLAGPCLVLKLWWQKLHHF